jgi:hypothetical protein
VGLWLLLFSATQEDSVMTYSNEKIRAVEQKRHQQQNGLDLCWEFLVATDCSVEDFKKWFDKLTGKQPLPFPEITMQSARELRGALDGTRSDKQENWLARLKSDRKTRKTKNEIRARVFEFRIEDNPLLLLVLCHVASEFIYCYWLDEITKKTLHEKLIHFQKHLKFKADSFLMTHKLFTKIKPVGFCSFGKSSREKHKIDIEQITDDFYQNNTVYNIPMEAIEFKKIINQYVTILKNTNGQNLFRRRREFTSLSIERGYYMHQDTCEMLTSSHCVGGVHPEISKYLKTLWIDCSDETNWADMYEIKELIHQQLGEYQAKVFWFILTAPLHEPRLAIYVK